MAQMAEILLPCLDMAGVRTVAEIGAFAGDLTSVLADWAARSGAHVIAIDPAPKDDLVALGRERPEVELVRETSLEAIERLELPDAIVIDGDHNYFTVSEELRRIAARAEEGALPLLLFHDVGWPHARRDDYFAPEQIPAEHRHPIAGDAGGLFPGDDGLRPGGLPYPMSAARAGGARNGVLTAVEDFVAASDGLRLAVVPAFFGFGVVWSGDAPWADRIAELVDGWDRHPVLERLEANRVLHLARGHLITTQLWSAQERLVRQEAVLRRMLGSSAFSVAEWLSRLRVRAGVARGQSAVSKDEIRRALTD